MKPKVIIVSEVSIDGKLTLAKGISSKELMSLMDEDANKYLHQIRDLCDAILVGAETIRTDNPSLTVRYVEGKNPIRVIPTNSLNFPEERNIFNTEKARTIIVTSQKAYENKKDFVEKLKRKNVEFLICGEDKVDFKNMLEKLYKMNIKSLMVEGGANINWQFIKEDLVDEIHLIVVPVIVGGEDVPTLVGGEGFKSLDNIKRYKVKDTFKLGSQIINIFKKA